MRTRYRECAAAPVKATNRLRRFLAAHLVRCEGESNDPLPGITGLWSWQPDQTVVFEPDGEEGQLARCPLVANPEASPTLEPLVQALVVIDGYLPASQTVSTRS